jgi:hypothetical protein
MIQSIEAIYGPPRWAQGEWESARPAVTQLRPKPPRQPVKHLVLRTLLFVAAAFLCWYAFIGGEASVQRTVALVLTATGIAREMPDGSPPVTAEYLVAMRTLGAGEVLEPIDPQISQLKSLLDEISPKCKEDRFGLAAALIAAHNALALRGVDGSALSILVQANAALSGQTRPSWPTSCNDVINRIVAARTPAP